MSLKWLKSNDEKRNRIYILALRNTKIRSLRLLPSGKTEEPDSIYLNWMGHNVDLYRIDFSGNLIESLDDADLFADLP